MSEYLTLNVSHNMELAHRLFTLPGKCQNIHGHGMIVQLIVGGWMKNGYAVTGTDKLIEFGELKKKFRAYLDENFDHRLHLNQDDPWARVLEIPQEYQEEPFLPSQLPGLKTWPGDPSTENFALWIRQWALEQVGSNVIGVNIEETRTNGVRI